MKIIKSSKTVVQQPKQSDSQRVHEFNIKKKIFYLFLETNCNKFENCAFSFIIVTVNKNIFKFFEQLKFI